MKHFATVVAIVLLWPSASYANSEITGLFDARSCGMAGTGAAFVDSAAAIPINPALLDQIDTLTLSLNAAYLRAQQQAPYTVWHTNQMGERVKRFDTIRTEPRGAVLPFVGGAYRVHERVVIGLAAYPMLGQGVSTSYRPAPDELPMLVASNKAAVALIEAAVPVSVRLLENLAMAAMWRVTYFTQNASTPLPSEEFPGVAINRATNSPVAADLALTGMHFGGVQFGLVYKPIPSLSLGLVYRSKVVVEGTGTASTKLGTMDTVLDARQNYTNPHMFRVGAAWTFGKLLLAADLKYLLYAESYKVLKTFTRLPDGDEMVREQPVYWKNAFSLSFGGEYALNELARLRAGYALISSATNPDYALALMSPPANSTFLSAGVGIKALDALTIDVGFAYIIKGTTISKATEHNAGAGTYAVRSLEASLSATYHR